MIGFKSVNFIERDDLIVIFYIFTVDIIILTNFFSNKKEKCW